jgi:hypothetical protein
MQFKLQAIDADNLFCRSELTRVDEENKGKAEIRSVTKIEIEIETFARQN